MFEVTENPLNAEKENKINGRYNLVFFQDCYFLEIQRIIFFLILV